VNCKADWTAYDVSPYHAAADDTRTAASASNAERRSAGAKAGSRAAQRAPLYHDAAGYGDADPGSAWARWRVRAAPRLQAAAADVHRRGSDSNCAGVVGHGQARGRPADDGDRGRAGKGAAGTSAARPRAPERGDRQSGAVAERAGRKA